LVYFQKNKKINLNLKFEKKFNTVYFYLGFFFMGFGGRMYIIEKLKYFKVFEFIYNNHKK